MTERFKKTVFENGLTLVSERVSGFRSISMGVWVKVGTRDENSDEAGASHFLEHMLFKGTKSRSALDIAKEVDCVGGEFNAFTAREHTCFHLLLLDRDYRLGLDILTDVLLDSRFKTCEIERERKVILQEISMVSDSPEELAHDLFFESLYGTHPLGKPILGTSAAVRKMTRQRLIKYFNFHYRPDQVVISIVGDVSHDDLKRKLKHLTQKPWPGRPSYAPNPSPSLSGQPKTKFMAPQIKEGFWWAVRPSEQVHLIWGVPGPHYSSRNRFAAFLLNVYLGGGMSSSLFQEIREKNGLAYSVYSSLSPFVDSGVFSIYVATGMKQIDHCLRLIEDCVGRLKTKPMKKNEFRNIQENLIGTILLSSDSVESRMSNIAKNEIFLGQNFSLSEICQKIKSVTPEDLQEIAKSLFHRNERSILALGEKPMASLAKKFGPVMLS